MTMPNPRHFRNYAIRAPRKTHYRPATCEEVGCLAYQNGWTLHKEMLTAELLYAATNSRRKYKEVQVSEGKTLLVYEAGQPCFASHEVPLERPAFFYAGPGTPDTFSTRRATKFDRPEDWTDSMQTGLDKIRALRERG